MNNNDQLIFTFREVIVLDAALGILIQQGKLENKEMPNLLKLRAKTTKYILNFAPPVIEVI